MALLMDQEDVIQLVGFRLGPKLFGADILNVREILRAPQIAAVDGVPSFIEGIVRLRGQILPVIDLGRLLGTTSSVPEGERTWVLIGQSGKRNVGYIVDSVTPIIRIRKDAVLPAPDIILSGLRSRYIKGVCETDKGLIVIVDLEHVLRADDIRALNELTPD